MTGRPLLKPHRIRYFLEQARNRSLLRHERSFQRREIDFLDLLIKLTGFFVVLDAGFHAISLGPVLSLVPPVIALPVLGWSYVCFRTKRYESATEALLLSCVLAFAANSACDTRFGVENLGYLLVPLVVGVLLLSPRSLVLLVAVDGLLVVMVGVLTLQSLAATAFLSMIVGLAFASSLALLVKRYLHAVAGDRRAEVAESESIFHTLITNMPVFLVVLDREGIITLVEGTTLESISFDRESFIGRSIFDAYKNIPPIVESSRRALNGEIVNSTVVLGDMVLDVWFSPLIVGDNERSGVIAVATDVTERMRAEEVLQEQASLLQSVSDAIVSVDMDSRSRPGTGLLKSFTAG